MLFTDKIEWIIHVLKTTIWKWNIYIVLLTIKILSIVIWVIDCNDPLPTWNSLKEGKSIFIEETW